ncbi:MAG TPA: HlyU family transcriptional regulator [Ktedonobacteraceae bacterium]|nr:HlyU family transcriptional regulator [Ktedonobacteraceae bacterium]
MGSDQIRPVSKGSKSVTYKGYTIQAAPHELIDTGQWGLNLFIMWSTETGEKSRHFHTSDQYATKEEAMAHCINYGQQIIDGKIPGLSVE